MDGKWSPSRGNCAANADRSRPHRICGRRISTSMRFQPSGLARSIGKNQTPVHHRLRNIRKARSRELQERRSAPPSDTSQATMACWGRPQVARSAITRPTSTRTRRKTPIELALAAPPYPSIEATAEAEPVSPLATFHFDGLGDDLPCATVEVSQLARQIPRTSVLGRTSPRRRQVTL